MTERIVLRAVCDRGAHVVAAVTAEQDGYAVRIKQAVLTGYGNRFGLVTTTLRLDGPADDPEAWVTGGGCECGHQFSVDSLTLRLAIEARKKVLVLSPWDRES